MSVAEPAAVRLDPKLGIARRIAHEVRPGMLVNLGIGRPSLVANEPRDAGAFFQAENGIIGLGARPRDLVLRERAPGVTVDEIVAATAARLIVPRDVPVIDLGPWSAGPVAG